MADLSPSHYLGCFEKRYGEQAIFVSERDSRKAVVSLGDAGWQTLLAVVDGPLPDVLLSETELGGCAPGGGRRLLPAREV